MELLYPQEHFFCYNYESGNGPSIECVEKKAGEKINFSPIVNEIVFILSGSMHFSFGKFVNQSIHENQIMLLPSKNHYTIEIDEDATFVVLRLYSKFDFCDHFSLEMLLKEKQKSKIKKELFYLTINSRMKDYLEFLRGCTEDGLKCSYFFEIKLKEVFFLLRAYYTKEELLSFFFPILSNDISFSDQVYMNQDKAKSINELAALLNYSLSGFKKRFKKVFGISAYQWMNKERAKKIYHEINCSRKTFTEIGFEFGFSSPSHFNNFCKKTFGISPGKIRKGSEVSQRQKVEIEA